MKMLLATLICLSTPISTIDLSDVLSNHTMTVVEINVDDVHPGTSSTFTYTFNNTTHSEIDLYFVKIEATNNNALTQNVSLNIVQNTDVLVLSETVQDTFIARLEKDAMYDLDFTLTVDKEAGNEIQGLSETYRLVFGIVSKESVLPKTGHQSSNGWTFVGIGAFLMLWGILIMKRSDDDEKEESNQ